MALVGNEKTNYAIQHQQRQQQQHAMATTAAMPALSFAFNVCPPSPESSPTRHNLPGMNDLPGDCSLAPAIYVCIITTTVEGQMCQLAALCHPGVTYIFNF